MILWSQKKILSRTVLSGMLFSGVFLSGVLLSGGASSLSARADVNDFSFSSMQATYLLGIDDYGRSTLTTTETLTAVFPETDQNRGIRRALPEYYQGRDTNLVVNSVEDSDGVPLEYTVEGNGEFLEVTIAANDFVHGSQTYVVTYTQRDVILTPSDGGGNQEFYWDVNGTGWAQSFDSVVAVVRVPAGIADALTGSAACYQGPAGATAECSSLESATRDDFTEFTATADAVAPGENLTVAIEFIPGTFVQNETDFFASPFAMWLLVVSGLGAALVIATLIVRGTRWRDHPGRKIIVAEYGPPDAVTPLVAATVFGQTGKAVAAAIMNLAVAGKIRVIDEGGLSSSASGKPARRGAQAAPIFSLEYVSEGDAQREETELLRALFGTQLVPGTQRGLKAVDTGLNRKLARVRSRVYKSTFVSGVRRSVGDGLRAILISASLVLTVGGVALGIAVANDGLGEGIPFLLGFGLIITSVLTIVFCSRVHPLTEVGAGTRDHLRGLREFIKLAEADRLRVLQSPTGALRVPVDVSDARMRLKLTEKVLPYAVLFGLEQEWSKELANLYAQSDSQPSWYFGGPEFNAALFATSLITFSSAVNTSWSAAAASSSAGGSAGGGFSGGGGGGGGGGGV
jgi:uncharacterized membrane protein YgcG